MYTFSSYLQHFMYTFSLHEKYTLYKEAINVKGKFSYN